jgi:hypothetical protein
MSLPLHAGQAGVGVTVAGTRRLPGTRRGSRQRLRAFNCLIEAALSDAPGHAGPAPSPSRDPT